MADSAQSSTGQRRWPLAELTPVEAWTARPLAMLVHMLGVGPFRALLILVVFAFKAAPVLLLPL